MISFPVIQNDNGAEHANIICITELNEIITVTHHSFQNVTFRRLLSLAVTDSAGGYYGTVQRVSGKAKVFQMKD